MTRLPIALTLGEPSGIGGEISLKAWQSLRNEVDFFLIADINHMRSIAGNTSIVEISAPSETSLAMPNGLPILHHPLPIKVVAGTPDNQNAPEVIKMIKRAVDLIASGEASAITTNPIHKKALQDGAGFAFPGHTEYLANLGQINRPVMMLSAPELRVVPVTIHIAVKDIAKTLTPTLLEETIRVTHAAMINDLGIAAPRIAVAGLNPHAGEGGAMGTEEMTVITPVLDKLRGEGMNLIGPMSADTMFHAPARKNYDLAMCMYHDQALIPIKTLNFSAGVNTTLGLPFIRTSPDHGTAFDIVGQDKADATSLIEALRTAWNMAKIRRVV